MGDIEKDKKNIGEKISNLNEAEIEKFIDELEDKGYTTEEIRDIFSYTNSDKVKNNMERILNEKNTQTQSINPTSGTRTPGTSISNYNFNIKEVSEEEIIRGCIESDVPVFLHGQSGDGKSARIKQIDNDPVIIYLRNATPESLNGRSVYDSSTGEIKDIKPSWLKKLETRCSEEPDKLHILFFDELSNALPSLQGMAFNIVLDKEVNGIWQLPKNARIVAAGNDMDESLAANQLAEPLFNRFAHVYIQTRPFEWLNWAVNKNIHPVICAYMACTNGNNLRTQFTGEEPNADPRKWEMASKMLYATNNPEMIRALVGSEITDEFVEFCNNKVITIEDVLSGGYKNMDLDLSLDEKHLTTAGLSWVNEEHYSEVRKFVKKHLGAEMCSVFDSYWARNDEKRLEKVAMEKLNDRSYDRSLYNRI